MISRKAIQLVTICKSRSCSPCLSNAPMSGGGARSAGDRSIGWLGRKLDIRKIGKDLIISLIALEGSHYDG